MIAWMILTGGIGLKRIFCVLIAFCLLSGVSAWAEEREWTYYESPYGFSLWYDAGAYLIEDEREDGAVIIYPLALYTPLETPNEAGWIAVPKDETAQAGIRIKMSFQPVEADWTPPSDHIPTDKELDVAWPYFCTTMNLEKGVPGPYTEDDLFVLLPSCFFTAGIDYPQGDPDGWSEKLWDVLSTLEFPPQPVITDDFLLDYFQGGAAGMQFIDVVYDEDAEPITLVPYRDMKDFMLEAVAWEFDADPGIVSDGFSVFPLYTADPLSPGNNLNIYCYFADVLPTLRIRYTDADGKDQCWYITQSGRDGSLLLLSEEEFF